MEVNILEVFTEYIAMMIILYKLSKHAFVFSLYNIVGLIINFIFVLVCLSCPDYDIRIRIFLYMCILMFIKFLLKFTWKQAIKYFGLTMIVISGLQLLLYILVGNRILGIVEINIVGIIENCLIIVLALLWKTKYVESAFKKIVWFKESIFIIVFFLFFFYLFYIRNETSQLDSQALIQASLGLIGIALVAILWVNTEKEKRRKAEELRAYEMYTKSFEDTIAAIRMKQHEFKNHINAILCMQYTIQDEEELKNAQMNYCQEILRDNSLN
ncbi:MAG: hypothetical protein J6C46_05025, partial [Clostridia bacterium]|nr:hypothetical protein [Clostridia bacterium]